jgi:hypothetical protein
MLKLNENLMGQVLREGASAFSRHDDRRRLTGDIAHLKQRICDQVTLVQELAWEAHDAASAKEALHEMRETLRDWRAHRDLLIEMQAQSKPARSPCVSAINDAQEGNRCPTRGVFAFAAVSHSPWHPSR